MYYSSANCSFIIERGGEHRDLKFTYALRVNSSNGIMPYYSWMSRDNIKYIDGNNIVEGALIINANIPNYLTRLFTEDVESVPSGKQQLLNSVEQELRVAETLLEQRVLSIAKNDANLSQEATSTLVTKLAPEAAIEIARARAKYYEEQSRINQSAKPPESATYALNDEYVIKVKKNNSVVDIIEGIKFNGKSFEITAGSSMNIKYAYPFVARRCSI